MNQQQLIQRVRSGEDVVLREPHVAFFARTLGPILLVLVSGIGLALVKGGLWWGLPLAGGIALIIVLLWVPFRKVPHLQITRQGITYQNRFFEWVQIETLGAGSAEYVPDWIYLVTSEGEQVDLDSTFGWKKDRLRDALIQLLSELHPDSARAQFEAHTKEVASELQGADSEIRFRRPQGPDDALEQVRSLLSSYYHPDCDTLTEVNDRVIRLAALDPHAFQLAETDCAGCGSAPMKDVVLTNGQTLYDAFTELQKRTPWKAQLGKFFLFSTILAPIGAIAGVLVPFGNAPALLGFLGGGVGLLVGIVISTIMYRPLRKRGYLW